MCMSQNSLSLVKTKHCYLLIHLLENFSHIQEYFKYVRVATWLLEDLPIYELGLTAITSETATLSYAGAPY